MNKTTRSLVRKLIFRKAKEHTIPAFGNSRELSAGGYLN